MPLDDKLKYTEKKADEAREVRDTALNICTTASTSRATASISRSYVQLPDGLEVNKNDPRANPNYAVFSAKIEEEIRIASELQRQLVNLNEQTTTRLRNVNPRFVNLTGMTADQLKEDKDRREALERQIKQEGEVAEVALQEQLNKHNSIAQQLTQQMNEDNTSFVTRVNKEIEEDQAKTTAEENACNANIERAQAAFAILDTAAADLYQKRRDLASDYNRRVDTEVDNRCKAPLTLRLAKTTPTSNTDLEFSAEFETEFHEKLRFVNSDNGWVLEGAN